jgi:glutamine synthetase type III
VEESSYLSLPHQKWDAVPSQERQALAELARTIDSLASDHRYTPEDLALQMSGIASRILDAVAGEERDLREMIQALRTCLAVSWDMYDKVQADRTTVSEHIDNLKEQIQSLEAELTALRLEGAAPPRE